LTLGALQLSEYLVQQRVPPRRPGEALPRFVPHLSPRVTDADWIGFKANPLIAFAGDQAAQQQGGFAQMTRPVADPHLSIEMRSSVDSAYSLSFNEPLGRYFEPHAQGSISSRLTLSCQPATVFFDLGLGSRVQSLLAAVSAPSVYLHGAGSQPDSSSHAHSEHGSFTFDLQRMQGFDTSNMTADELLERLQADRRQSQAAESHAYAQIVVLAPSIQLHILFPAGTPSQQQPHPYTRLEQQVLPPFIDARGVLRPESIVCELHDVSVANEMELAPNPSAHANEPARSAPAPAQDAEWVVRFQQAQAAMHLPRQEAGRGGDMTTPSMLVKRLLSTSYPTLLQDGYGAPSAATASCIRILTRAVQVAPRFVADRARSQQAQVVEEKMFFDALPNVRFWEPQVVDGHKQRVYRPDEGYSAADAAGASQAQQQPDAALFERAAVSESAMVVTVHLPVAAVHLAKADYDMLLFLVGVYLEVAEAPTLQLDTQIDGTADAEVQAPAEAALQAARNFAQASMHESVLASHADDEEEEEDEDHVDLNGLARSQRYRHPSASFHAGLSEEDVVQLGAAGSRSRSDSGSSDSSNEMFESVVGADSVILQQPSPLARFGQRSRMRHSRSPPIASAASAANAAMSQSQLLRPARSNLLHPSHTDVLSDPASDQPLTHDSLANSPDSGNGNVHSSRLMESQHEDDEEEADRQAAALLEQQQPSLGSSSQHSTSSSRSSPIHGVLSMHDADGGAAQRHGSDTSDEESMPSGSDASPHMHGSLQPQQQEQQGDDAPPSARDLSDSTPLLSHSGSAGKKISFGTASILVPQQRASASAMAEAANAVDVAEANGAPDNDLDSNASSSADLNPAAIFDRASGFSARSQLLQPPSLGLTDTLPPVSELLHPSSLATSLARSSLGDSRDDPRMFESFRAPPTALFDPQASLTASVDYSHLPAVPPSQPAVTALLPPLPQSSQQLLMQSATARAPRSVVPSLAPAPAARQAHPRHVPPPITSASAFPGGKQQQRSTAAFPGPPVRPLAAFRHAMSLRLQIVRASLVLQDDPLEESLAPRPSGVLRAPAPANLPSPGPPQSFHVDIGEVRLFSVVEYNNEPTQYLAVRAGDLTMREYQGVITDEGQLFTTPSMPILFKTMGDAPDESAASPPQPVDAWGLSRDDSPPIASARLERLPSDSGVAISSVAWKNPVLLLNFIIKLDAALNLRTTEAVVNLRALTLQFFPHSKWIEKLMCFFMPTVWSMPQLPPMFNLPAIPAPPPLVLIKDLIHVHLHAYDVSLDYNPLEIAPRAVVSLDHVHVQTTVYPDTTRSVLKIELRDMAVYMVPHSSKVRYATTRLLTELGQPFLHRVGASSLFAQLDSLGYARLATLDLLDIVVSQNAAPAPGAPAHSGGKVGPHVPALGVEVSNGTVTVLTCSDSFNVLVALATHFANSVIQVQQVAEVDVTFEGDVAREQIAPRLPAVDHHTSFAPIHSHTSGGFQANAFSTVHQRAAYLLDDDEEEDEDGEEHKQSSHRAAAGPSALVAPLQPRNILDELDHVSACSCRGMDWLGSRHLLT